MIGEEIVHEIDSTLDQLIRNAEVISHVDLKDLSETELEAFQKTQESLLQHLMRMDETLSLKINTAKKIPASKIQEKLLRFEKLKSTYHKPLADKLNNRPIVCKRKGKRFLDLARRAKSLCLVRN